MRPLTVRRRPPKFYLDTFVRAIKNIVLMPVRECSRPPYLKKSIYKRIKLCEMKVKNRLKIAHIKGYRKVDDGPPLHHEAFKKAKIKQRVKHH